VVLLRVRRVALVVALAALTAACGVGSGTLRIADAEALIVTVAEEIVRDVGLTVTAPIRPEPLEQCALRSGGSGLRTRVEVRGTLPAGVTLGQAFDGASAVLVSRDLTLVESGVPGTLLGQRDGITVTVGSDGRLLELDALTGCRPR
jgi:hypothetical protein